jgi:Flp pilus assembly pilin Flp
MAELITVVKKLFRREQGASAAEYAVLLLVLTGGVIAAVIALGVAIGTQINAVTALL